MHSRSHISFGFGVLVQFMCSYITLPLYALVTQMGSTMKRSIFDEQTSKALKQWHKKVAQKTSDHHGHSKAETSHKKNWVKTALTVLHRAPALVTQVNRITMLKGRRHQTPTTLVSSSVGADNMATAVSPSQYVNCSITEIK
ncbi:hypothetical protein F3Y22_tig00008468pilonHSYRG00010 [Hibiscus syriacus]|uniref:Uncharacterized protein n=1 Tax=Hibiscus syriacus TaxID=106335 RepID=A0A6A3CDP8_HIBSY|nr:hypothetical protein F3Y22_tig00008468pilonHSYRG00010 [Hibiscus syriacus]